MTPVFFSCSALILLIGISACSCSKSGGDSNTTTPPPTTGKVSFTANDATAAYNDFNKHLYDPVRKIYFRASDKSGTAAIWCQAIYWDMAMNAWKRTKDTKYKQLVADIFQGGGDTYANYNWRNDVKWFIWDDMMWWIISLARAYELTGEQQYLDLSKEGFNFVWYGDPSIDRKGSHESNGGMEWDWHRRGKTACINYPTIIAAMTLHNITKDEEYLNKAKEVYGWARTNLFDAGNGRIADHKVDNEPTNWSLHTYNQATAIGAGVLLYNKTKDITYLNDAKLVADYTMNKMSDADGILSYESGEEQGVYNAILAQYMIRLIEDGNQPQYLPWLRKNINTAYGKRNSSTGLMGKNYKVTPASGVAVSSYDACSIPALMQVVPPEQ
ncbi:MAG: glycoside hydrolase family 76 protein [Candidatus Pseudobacter hemicellulosilyticus]|uniref:Glycoside hydrolase family 76 protein n=1 Tax=Candidatus Pseudobacter hemicellulosilyticus TaxID=3121375 RepID=A0AAJ5WNG9_9BACT|nr:MAG: glycoside hydrolase family 76 protein [Pseudobacter sp.]